MRLQPQPAQLLTILLARPNEIVLRDELREQLWGTDTYVDFNRSLNFCVAQLRSALNDSTDSPRYIKTIPKRGYQFIAPIATPQPPKPPPPNWKPLAAIALLLTLAIAIYLWQRAPGPEAVIAIARFENLTGDTTLDPYAQSLQNSVIADLTNRNRFSVIGNAAILQRPRDLLKVHETLRADRIILGSVERGKNNPEVFLQFISLPNQVHLKVTRVPLPASTPPSELAPKLVETLLTGPYRTR